MSIHVEAQYVMFSYVLINHLAPQRDLQGHAVINLLGLMTGDSVLQT